MRALTIDPRQSGSLAVTEVPDPDPGDDKLFVEAPAVGVCGTDRKSPTRGTGGHRPAATGW